MGDPIIDALSRMPLTYHTDCGAPEYPNWHDEQMSRIAGVFRGGVIGEQPERQDPQEGVPSQVLSTGQFCGSR